MSSSTEYKKEKTEETLQKEIEKGLIIKVLEQFIAASVMLITFGIITALLSFYLGLSPIVTIISFGMAVCTLTFGLIITLIRYYQFIKKYNK